MCLKVIKNQTMDVLDSEFWLSASEDTVISILKQKKLNICETEILEALIKWGTAKVEEGVDIRGIIDSSLKLVRFRCLDYIEFSRICCNIGNVLAEAEKLNILLSIIEGNEKLMPPGFARESVPRNLTDGMAYSWQNNDLIETEVILNKDSHPPSQFVFSISQSGFYLEGVCLDCLSNRNKEKHLHLTCSLHVKDELLATVTFNEKNSMNVYDDLFFPFPVLLTKDVLYTITVEYLEGFPINSVKRTELGKVFHYDQFILNRDGCSENIDIWALQFAEIRPKS